MLSWLYTLVLVIVVALSSWVMLGPVSIVVCIIVFGFALALAVRSWMGFWVFVVCLIMLFYLMLPGVESPREAARSMTCRNQLKHIALALHNYHQVYGCFPPACVADKGGKPMYSWRVLILPYLGLESLYKQYDFNEPWDGPNNRRLLGIRTKMYVCPSDRKANEPGATVTSYIAVVGSNAAFDGKKSRTLADVDSRTIMLVETADAGIGWTEPKDLDIDAITVVDDSASQVKPTSRHMRSNGFFYHDTPSVVNVAMMDGSIRSLPADLLTRENCKKLFQIGGFKDKVELECKKPELQINWLNVIAFAVWLVAVILLFYQAVHSRKTRLPEGGPIEKGEKETVEPSSQA